LAKVGRRRIAETTAEAEGSLRQVPECRNLRGVATVLRTRLPTRRALAVLLAACGCSRPSAPELAAPDLAAGIELPPELREVSGIVAVDARTLACVQDELGAIFFVDLHGERPVRAVPFGPPGDYEGLAKVGDDYWVLRSDGLLLQVSPSPDGLVIAASHRLPLSYGEYEGLCWQPSDGHLLVLPKDRVGARKAERDRLHAYAFVPATAQLLPEPVLTVVRGEAAQAVANLLPDRATPTDPEASGRRALKLHCSEILGWPGREEFLLLSAVDQLLLRVDREGRVLGARVLDAKLLPQAEAMAWLPDGRLLLASEGRAGPARLLVVSPP